jgi:hypothetical protein
MEGSRWRLEKERGEEDMTRHSYQRGMLIGTEFSFTEAIGPYCEGKVRAGRFAGKDQFEVNKRWKR